MMTDDKHDIRTCEEDERKFASKGESDFDFEACTLERASPSVASQLRGKKEN